MLLLVLVISNSFAVLVEIRFNCEPGSHIARIILVYVFPILSRIHAVANNGYGELLTIVQTIFSDGTTGLTTERSTERTTGRTTELFG